MLKSRIPAIAAELDYIVKAALEPGAHLVSESAKQRVPVETGDLRDAIHVQGEPEGVYVVAGDNRAFYGHLVEHGTSHTAPRPFLVPALEENRKEIVALAAGALRKAVDGLSVKI